MKIWISLRKSRRTEIVEVSNSDECMTMRRGCRKDITIDSPSREEDVARVLKRLGIHSQRHLDQVTSFIYSTRIYVCIFVCIFVCLKPISFWTDGPIWKILFLLVQSWSGEGFRQKKLDLGSYFFRNQEKLNFTLFNLTNFSAFNFV